MRISNPEAKGKALARIIQAVLLVSCFVIYFYGQTDEILIDSSGSPGEYRTGPTENK